MEYSLDRPKLSVYSDDAILEELRRVAAHYENRRFSRREYDAITILCKGSSILRRFGTWQAALDAAGLSLKVVGKNLYAISEQQLFEEMKRIWSEVGHRPSHDEWVKHKPRHSYGTYKRRFNGWVNACTKFIEYVTGEKVRVSDPSLLPINKKPVYMNKPRTANPEKRNISERLRYRVLARDFFKCVLCGKSPASEPGVKLHIDHILPFAKGGQTTMENLRSVCNRCNWGKGDEIEVVP
jgi:hypothetical protein